MRDRQMHRSLAQIVTIRSVERAAARHELMVADALKRQADEAVEQAHCATRQAADAWQEHLSGTTFAPEFARALADQLVGRTRLETAAKAQADAHEAERAERESDWHASDATLRQAEKLHGNSARALAREQEERALEALADRVTFAWRRR